MSERARSALKSELSVVPLSKLGSVLCCLFWENARYLLDPCMEPELSALYAFLGLTLLIGLLYL